ncbi:alkene reductase [Blastococcus saxobsidens]|uniref:N-ethylmaleimide reductase n=1 Tax=Blastococcus saxobsidens TaxID=138336 RepID=A0A4Q7Y2M4_9ACTN|nr:alkene reductase [Blastococcus saxobsidens]RZU31060.1 N-ethylmaleimide reductase [Blastococcus saxobsidens]
MTSTLFTPYSLGRIELANRLVMAPMTRNRAGADGVPTDSMVTYYAQRAGAGLIVTEGTQPSAVGQGYPNTPGIHTAEQAAAWRRITDAVHERGGRIFLQLMHAGRISHPSLQPGAGLPVAPSAVRPAGQVFTAEGLQDFVEPRALETAEVEQIVREFAEAARLAIEQAGFDGVEVHGANGYLPHQFLAEGTNQRSDRYGGSADNRARFLLEATAAVAEAVGAERVGVRVSPANTFNDIVEHETEEVYAAVVSGLEPLGLTYLHVVEGPPSVTEKIRSNWSQTLIVNPAFSLETTTGNLEALLADGRADLAAVGRAFLANPDLVHRLERGAELNVGDPSSFYGGTDAGYIDYPTLDQTA